MHSRLMTRHAGEKVGTVYTSTITTLLVPGLRKLGRPSSTQKIMSKTIPAIAKTSTVPVRYRCRPATVLVVEGPGE
jgi:hypothetical protein